VALWILAALMHSILFPQPMRRKPSFSFSKQTSANSSDVAVADAKAVVGDSPAAVVAPGVSQV
jgi:hypothetical protein